MNEHILGEIPLCLSGFGAESAAMAGRVGDEFIIMGPDTEALRRFRDAGGEDKPVLGGLKAH
ncbi:hypothetical protein [Streptodolium elevatio]